MVVAIYSHVKVCGPKNILININICIIIKVKIFVDHNNTDCRKQSVDINLQNCEETISYYKEKNRMCQNNI